VIEIIIVDEATGEIKGNINQGDRIIRKASVDYLNDTEKWIPEDSFIKAYPEALRKASSKMTGTECFMSIYLMPYISYTTGMLMKGNNQPLKRKDMLRIFDMTEKTFDNNMNSLILKGIFSKNKVGREVQYFANPYLFTKGNKINKTLKSMFRNFTFESN